MDFSVATQAGVSQSELAQVFGVSRCTVNLWLNGHMKPHRLHATQIAERLELLTAAIQNNLIPKHGKRRRPRHQEIAHALQQCAAQTPAPAAS